MRRLFAIALIACACHEEVRELQLVIGAGSGMRVSDGLICPIDDSHLLIQSLWTDPERGGCMVIDVVPTQGSPGCRLSELTFACTQEPCEPDPQYRVRLPLEGPPPSTTDEDMNPISPSQAILTWIRNHVRDQVVFDDAPDTLAILRATIVRSACDDVGDEPRFACSDVIGCLYSCPIAIGHVSGDVVLDLDSFSQMNCVRDVRLCASDRMFDRDPSELPCDTDPLVP